MDDAKGLLAALAAVVGEDHVVSALEELACYGVDAAKVRAVPDVVVRPATAAEVSGVLRLANERRVPVYPPRGRFRLHRGASRCAAASRSRWRG